MYILYIDVVIRSSIHDQSERSPSLRLIGSWAGPRYGAADEGTNSSVHFAGFIQPGLSEPKHGVTWAQRTHTRRVTHPEDTPGRTCHQSGGAGGFFGINLVNSDVILFD